MTDPAASAPPRTSRHAAVFLTVSITTFVVAVLAFRAVMLPFVLGILVAYVLHPVVGIIANMSVRGRRMPRWSAVLVIYVALLTTLALGLYDAVPRLVDETRGLAVNEVPLVRRRFERRWLPAVRRWTNRMLTGVGEPAAQEAPSDPSVRIEPNGTGGFRVLLPNEGIEIEQVSETRSRVVPARTMGQQASDERQAMTRQLRALGEGHLADIVKLGGGIVGGLITGIFRFFMTLMISAYLLVTEAQIFRFLRGLVRPASRDAFDELLHRLDRGLSGVVRGQLIICMVNGVLSAIGFALAGLKYWPVFSVIAAVLSIIPIFGSILSSVPAIAVGLTQSFGTAVFVLLWILGIHQLEANLLNPKIMGDAAKIHPVLVVFSLLAGEHFFGILGALLAVPVMSICQSVFLHWRAYALPYSDDDDAAEAAAGAAPVGGPSSGRGETVAP